MPRKNPNNTEGRYSVPRVRTTYTDEQKQNILAMIDKTGMDPRELGPMLNIPPTTIYNWVRIRRLAREEERRTRLAPKPKKNTAPAVDVQTENLMDVFGSKMDLVRRELAFMRSEISQISDEVVRLNKQIDEVTITKVQPWNLIGGEVNAETKEQ